MFQKVIISIERFHPMCKKITDIDDLRRTKRQQTGWSQDEIDAAAEKELEEYIEVMKNNSEPDELVSGDMNTIHEESDDEEK